MWFCVSGSLNYIRTLHAYDVISGKQSRIPLQIAWDGFRLPEKENRMSDLTIVLRSMTIGALRFGLFVVCIVLMMLLISIAPSSLSQSISHHVSRLTLVCLGLTLIVSGSLEPSTGAPVVVANHVGMIDVLILLATGEMSFVADNGIRKFYIIGRIWGYVAERIDCLFVSRSSSSSRSEIRDQLRTRLQDIRAGLKTRLAIFPEGTTSNGCGLLEFKNGAFENMVPVQPITLNYSNKEWGYCSVWSDVYFAYIMGLPSSNVHVKILPIQTPQADDTPASFSQRVRELMIRESGLSDFGNIPNPARTHNHICTILNRHA
jgi:1-acyl-sn-glycerol-3-phosphate acyltransferase